MRFLSVRVYAVGTTLWPVSGSYRTRLSADFHRIKQPGQRAISKKVRTAAITCGAAPVRTWLRSSSNAASPDLRATPPIP